jgi:hypothetical protein
LSVTTNDKDNWTSQDCCGKFGQARMQSTAKAPSLLPLR